MIFPTDEDQSTAAGELAHVTDHADVGASMLLSQLRGKPRLEALLAAVLGEVQALEDAIWDVYVDRRLEHADGVRLDAIGAVVKQARGSLADDEDYRAAIRGRILANRSSGSHPEVVAVMRAALDDDTIRVLAETRAPGEATVRLVGELDRDPYVFSGLAHDAAALGIRIVTEWSAAAPEDTLRLTDEGGATVDGKALDDEGGSTDADAGVLGGASDE